MSRNYLAALVVVAACMVAVEAQVCTTPDFNLLNSTCTPKNSTCSDNCLKCGNDKRCKCVIN